MAIEILKELDPMKVIAWDRIHDMRKLYRCERCGAEWKCEPGENKFGKSHEYNGDPDILCQCCGFPTVKKIVLREMENTLEPLCKNCKLFYTTPKCKYTTGPDQYADECHAYKEIEE